MLGMPFPSKCSNEVVDNIMTFITQYEVVNAASAPQQSISGTYKGFWQQRTFVIEFVIPISNEYTNYELPWGRIKFAGKTYEFTCFKTASKNKYEIRLRRPSNPAILGEYLGWRAYIEPNQSSDLKLVVFADLSSIEKLKYTLPEQGAVLELNSTDANNKKYYSQTTTFSGNTSDSWSTYVFSPDGTCSLYFGVNTEHIEGEWTRGHVEGRYYIKNMVIFVTWEDEAREEYRLINNGSMFKDAEMVMIKTE